MIREGQCSSYTIGDKVCRDGFPVSAICMGFRCFDCGRYSDTVPACQKESLDARFVDDAGRLIYNLNK